MPDTLLTTSQAADFLRVSPSRIRQLILENRIPATKVGRDQLIKQSDLETFAVLPRKRTGRPSKI